MKRCSYCGAEYPDEVSVCVIDKQPLQEIGSLILPAPPPADKPEASDLLQLVRMMKNFTHPFVVTGLLLTIFAVFILLDALMSLAWVEAVFGIAFGTVGWLFWKRNFPESPRRLTWLRFLTITLPILPILYVLTYFILMDRSRPTDPAGEKRFQSSLRWMPYNYGWGQRRPYVDVTIFNFIFNPADKVYFKWFPRTDEEIQRLKSLGYFQ